MYEQEAQARVELRYRFSSAPLLSGLLAGAGDFAALHRPSFYEN
jgi:hypothetical protein